MATLTYDPTPADQPEFSEEEQDSIAVGEQLEQQQNQLLAGKYENAQELERAYVELQRKLGEQSEDEVPDAPEETSNEEEEEETEEVEEDTSEISMSQEDVDSLMNMVGGKDAYSNMMSWASETMNQQEIDMFDHVMDLDNPWAAFFAVKSIQNAYESSVGKEGQMLTGKAASSTRDEFRSQAEVIRAMEDPRYESDPAYRQDIFEKLERSNLNF